jgi:hypothetical protein
VDQEKNSFMVIILRHTFTMVLLGILLSAAIIIFIIYIMIRYVYMENVEQNLKSPAASLNIPLRNLQDGSHEALISLQLDMSRLKEYSADIAPDESLGLYLFGDEYMVMLSPSVEEADFQKELPGSELREFTGQPQDKTNFLYNDTVDNGLFIAHKSIGSLDTTLVITQAQGKVIQPLHSALRIIAIAIVTLIVAFLVASLWMSKRVSKPVRQLTA